MSCHASISLEALVMEVGIRPLSLFWANRSHSRLGSEFPKSEESVPENSLPDICNACNVDMLNIENGMDPCKRFMNTSSTSSIGRVPISCGNSLIVYIDINEEVTLNIYRLNVNFGLNHMIKIRI